MSYASDRAWSDRFIPHMRLLIGPHLLEPSSVEIDTKFAADLVVFRARDVTIACRVRRPGYADRYPFQFTIRSHRASGARTELEKLVDGWGDWMFYGHASNSGEPTVERWWLLDLAAWRAALIRDKHRRINAESKSNGDGTAFVAFDVRDFPVCDGARNLIIAASHPIWSSPAVAAAPASAAPVTPRTVIPDDDVVESMPDPVWLAAYNAGLQQLSLQLEP